jgi:hypothetical protein
VVAYDADTLEPPGAHDAEIAKLLEIARSACDPVIARSAEKDRLASSVLLANDAEPINDPVNDPEFTCALDDTRVGLFATPAYSTRDAV